MMNAELAVFHQDASGAYMANMVTGTVGPNTNSRGTTLRSQGAKRAGNTAGLSLITLRLAACSGASSSSEEPVEEATVCTRSKSLIAKRSDDVAEDFEVDVQVGDVGTFTIITLTDPVLRSGYQHPDGLVDDRLITGLRKGAATRLPRPFDHRLAPNTHGGSTPGGVMAKHGIGNALRYGRLQTWEPAGALPGGIFHSAWFPTKAGCA
jgi:hypothetical protein